MQLSIDISDDLARQLQLLKNTNEFISQAISTALAQNRQTNDWKINCSIPPGHVSKVLALLDLPEFKNAPIGNPEEIEQIIAANRNAWND